MICTCLFITIAAIIAQGEMCSISYDKDWNGTKVDCQNLRLNSVPQDLPNDTVWLNMNNNDLRPLVNGSFLYLKQLGFLSLQYCNISILYTLAFEGLGSLVHLDLQYNHLLLDTYVYPNHVFEPLKNLQHLYLGHNDPRPYGTMPDEIFTALRNLRTLQLDTFNNYVFSRGFAGLMSLTTLDLSTGANDGILFCAIDNVYNETFGVFENIPLEVIDLSYCNIRHVEPGAFLPLQMVSVLRIENVFVLPTAVALKSLFGLNGKNVSKVLLVRAYSHHDSFSEITNQIITKEVVSTLSDLCIQYLDLRDNRIVYLDNFFIKVFAPCLEHIDLSQNTLLGSTYGLLTLSSCKHLQYANISRQERFRTSGTQALMSSSHAKLRHKRILKSHFPVQTTVKTYTTNVNFSIPPLIEVLDLRLLSSNSGKIFITDINGGTYLVFLDISYNGIVSFDSSLTGVKHLLHLDMSGNDGTGLKSIFLKSFPNLEYLAMNNMGLETDSMLETGDVYKAVATMSNLSHLEVAGNNIRYCASELFSQLKVIDISRNNFMTIPFDLDTVPKLAVLDMSQNALTGISEEHMILLDKLGKSTNLTMKLNGNPLSCSCNSLAFVQWLFTSSVKFDNTGKYSCVTENGSLSTTYDVYQHYNYHWLLCKSQFWFPFALTALCVLSLIYVSVFVTLKNWTWIQHRMLVWIGRGARRSRRLDFTSDAYVAHSESNHDEVMEHLRYALEETNGLRVVLPDRDFLANRRETDQIAVGMKNSWRVLIVVTREFLEDCISEYIMATASSQWSILNPYQLLLLIIGDVNEALLPPSLLSVVPQSSIFFKEEFPACRDEVWKCIADKINENE